MACLLIYGRALLGAFILSQELTASLHSRLVEFYRADRWNLCSYSQLLVRSPLPHSWPLLTSHTMHFATWKLTWQCRGRATAWSRGCGKHAQQFSYAYQRRYSLNLVGPLSNPPLQPWSPATWVSPACAWSYRLPIAGTCRPVPWRRPCSTFHFGLLKFFCCS